MKEKLERKLIVGNLLESQSQARISKTGGEFLTQNVTSKSSANSDESNDVGNKLFTDQLKANMLNFTMPLLTTLMVSSVSYPLAIKIIKSRLFGLRNWYAVHLAIAPFLALINVIVFGMTHGYFRIKVREQDFI